MSQQERNRLGVKRQVKTQELSVVQAAEILAVSYRQTKRVWRRYQEQGDAGLVHRSRGRPSARRKAPKLRQQVLRRYRERSPDFGPTRAAEHLAKEGLEVDHETLRRWRLAAGLHTLRRARQKHRQWRERTACLGQMAQWDGSHHDWFEGRRAAAVLMAMVDDATHKTVARFFEQETTHASYDTFAGYARQYGVPASVDVDQDSIYRCERLPTVAEQIAGSAPQTQFGRAMAPWGVELILAHSPPAQGRVERRNGLLQDRLVKELRLAGSNDLESANAYLDQRFLPELNRRFVVAPACGADVHRSVPRNLKEVLSWEETRVVQKDGTVAWSGRWFQIDRAPEPLSLAGQPVVVRRLRDETMQLLHRGQKLRWRELPARPVREQPARQRVGRIKLTKPAKKHPWRRFGMAVGQAHGRAVKAEGRVARAEGKVQSETTTEGHILKEF